jgi:flagellar biogenesis protein FliO
MDNRWMVAVALIALAAFLPAQEPEFATTAPAKILLPIDEIAAQSPEVPEPSATVDEAETAPEIVDPVVADIGAEMAEQDASEQAEPTEATPEGIVAEENPLPSPARSAAQALVALSFTLILILLIYAAARRWGKRTPLLAGQQLARVIGRVGLSPQASLHFVQTNGEVLVIGVTQQQVSLLRTFDANDFGTPADAPVEIRPDAPNEPAASFMNQLKASRAAMGLEAAVDEDLDQLKGELQRLKQYFQDSTRGRD